MPEKTRFSELARLARVTGRSINVVIADYIRFHAFDVLRSSLSVQKKVIKLLDEVESDLAAKLARENQRTVNNESRMKGFLAAARETIKSAYGTVGSTVKKELIELSEIESIFASKSINDAVGAAITDTFLTRTQIEKLVSNTLIEGAPSADWWARQATSTANAFADQVRLGIAEGDTLGQIAQRIKGGKRAGEVVPGVPNVRGVTAPGRGFMKRPKKNAEALVRTSFMQVAAETRMETYKGNSGVIAGIQQLSTLDGRTTPICMAYSGACWDLDKNPIRGTKLPYKSGVPRHWSCRSVEIPILKTLDQILNIKGMPSIPMSTRSSIDGQIAADKSFDSWLKDKPDEFHDKMLGKGKAELWRSGKVKLADLIDIQTGKAMTLAQLRASVG